ncbi:ankyrin [Penicillium malachiteum]|uniref:ankyrin n=1 Tax=Penicillium malachiteum TaxID=1324776 RepID=UPI002549BDA7|nr:ankyrin [Penicillium malachiteum]KAJ5730116.1 ankyrin [Penicillium malachiteum]
MTPEYTPSWDVYKSEIERLYIHENKTREEVMGFMTTKYCWNKRDDQWIAWQVGKREREDKESEVFVNGIQIHPAKIAKSRYRKGFLTEYSRYGPSPSTPEGYVVATPAPPGIHVLWTRSDSLPWIRFTRLFELSQNNDISPSSPAFLTLNSSHNSVAARVNFGLMQHLSTIVPWNKLQYSPNMYSASRTSAALSILMPENEPGQHETLSADLSTSGAESWESMSVTLFLISNHLTSWTPADFSNGIERDDKLVLQILRDTGWDNLKHLKILISSREPTAQAMTEKVFSSALRQGNFDMVQKMLQSGMNPNGLIDHGADVNFSVNDDGKTALFYAIFEMNEPAIQILLAHGALVTMACAERIAFSDSDFYKENPLLGDIIDIYLDQDVRKQRDNTTTVEIAVRYSNVPLVERFITKGAHLNGRLHFISSRSEYETSLLGSAVEKGNIEIVGLLLPLSAHEDPSLLSRRYMSPLALAAKNGLIDICELLLNSGADIRAADEGQKTLLELAVLNNNLALCQLLINHGAKVDRVPCKIQHCPSALMIAVQRSTILAAAVEVGDETILTRLLNSGARPPGLEINKIGNLQTALFLQINGTLPRLLDHFGPGLLSAAISDQDDDLAWFLLERNADKKGKITDPHERTPLWAALQVDSLGFALNLLSRGSKATDDALAEAIKNNRDHLLPPLLSGFTGSAPTAASAAVLKGSITGLELLREANIDLKGAPRMSHHSWDIKGIDSTQHSHLESVLEIAAWKADDWIFKYLLEWASSAQMDWSPASVGRALIIAIFKKKNDHIFELMQLELDLNCDITVTSDHSLPFDESDQVSVVRDLLLLKGANVNYLGEGSTRRTPLQHAVELGNMEIVNLLLERGADINAPAAENGGADINQEGAWVNGRTALMGAAEHGRIGMLQMLLDEGALVVGEFESEHDFWEAVGLAEDRGHYAAARLLKSFKESVELGALEQDSMSG